MWRLRLLGGFTLERPGETITRLRTQKTVSLLAWLALHPNREHGREELIERFWPESDLEQGRASLRVALNALRKALEPPPTAPDTVLIATRTHVKIRPEALTTDVAAFEAALRRNDRATAEALYTGPLLPGYYDTWILEEQERLEALRPGPTPSPTLAPSTSPPPARLEGRVEHPRDVGGGQADREPPGSLPLTLTRFFGREREQERLTILLTDPTLRLVTLTGPGGTGKTRLAVEVGKALQRRFEGGVWFVPLAETRDSRRLLEGLRDALELPRTGNASEQVRARLGECATLVLFDNLEQLADDAALALAPLLALLPQTRFLLTSRVRLGLAGEHVFPIASLPLPTPGAPLEQLTQNAALALFCDRARAALPEFGLTPRNAEALAQLCCQLEGVPLALELAASWAGQLTPRQMQERFTAALALEGRRNDREARHLSVRAALRWSLELLPPELSALFAELSVFRSAFTLEAAALVCPTGVTSFALNRLREHSLLQIDLTDERPRFSMLESVRDFAAECLGERTLELRRRHADWMLAQEPQTAPETLAERENCESALLFLEEHAPDEALGLAARRVRAWAQAALLDFGIVRLERILAHFPGDPPSSELRVALSGLAALHFYQGDVRLARHYFERCAKVAEALGDRAALAEAQRNLGTIAVAEGSYTAAREALGAALENLTDGQAPLIRLFLHSNLGVTHYALEELDEAEHHFRTGLAISQEIGEVRWAINCWHGLGALATERGAVLEAEELHRQGLAYSREVGDPLLIGDGLSLVASSQMETGKLAEAARLLLESADFFEPCNGHDSDRRLAESSARLLLLGNQPELGIRFLTYADQLIAEHQIHLFSLVQRDRARLRAELQAAVPATRFTRESAHGHQLARTRFFTELREALELVEGCDHLGGP